MELKNQVVSLDIAKRLKELGVKQNALNWWIENIHTGEITLNLTLYPTGSGSFSAFTCSELGEMLPKGFRVGKVSARYQRGKGKYKAYNWHDGYGTIEKVNKDFFADTLADVMGKMLIYLYENGLIK